MISYESYEERRRREQGYLVTDAPNFSLLGKGILLLLEENNPQLVLDNMENPDGTQYIPRSDQLD